MSTADFTIKGSFADVVLPASLVKAMNRGFTGMFRAERESIIKVIYFKEGDIAFASSNQPSDRLGEVLIKRGQLTREQLDMAMSKLEANVSLGRMLVELGYLSPKELLAGAKNQVEEILYSLNTWRDGTYEFVEGPLAPRIVDLKLNMRQVVFQSIMQLEDRGWVLEQIGSMEAVLEKAPDIDEALAGMTLDAQAAEVVTAIDGHNTIRDLCATSSLDEFTVTKIAAATYLLNLAHLTSGGTGEGEFLSPTGAAEQDDTTTMFGSPAAGETVPGFAPSFDAEDEEAESLEDEEMGGTTASLPATGATTVDSSEADDGPEGDEELSYDEEVDDWDDEGEEEGGRKPWLIPVALVAFLAFAAAAVWTFKDSLPFIGGSDDSPEVVSTSVEPTPAKPAVAPTKPTAEKPVAAPSAAPAGVPKSTPKAAPKSTPKAAPKSTPKAAPKSTPKTAVKPSRTPAKVRLATKTPPVRSTTTKPPRVTKAAPPPSRRPSTSKPSPSEVTSGAKAQAGRTALASGNYSKASKSFRGAISGSRAYSLQLELICQPRSIEEGWGKASGNPNYILIPIKYRGRSCYRVLWGAYASKTEAARAANTVPSFFRSQLGGKPFPVVRLSSIR